MKEVADVLDVDEQEIRRIQKISADPSKLDIAMRGKDYKDEFSLMIDSFVVSGLIRGRYYGAIAAEAGNQFLFHQLRREVLSHVEEPTGEEYRLANTERYVSAIIVSSSFRESDYRMRISEWGNSVVKARNALILGKVDLSFKEFDDVAVEEAVRISRMLGIRTQSKWLDKGIDAGIAVGVGVLTSFFLSPWSGFLVGLASGAIGDRMKIGYKIAGLSETRRRLGELAAAYPGKISRSWSGAVMLGKQERKGNSASATAS